MDRTARMIGGIGLLVAAIFAGNAGRQRLQPTVGDQIIQTSEQFFGARAPDSWKSDKPEAYLYLGVTALCGVGGLLTLLGGKKGGQE